MQRFLSIGVMAHVDAGKTTFSEQLLYHTGSIRTRGRVDHQDAFLDNDRLERERGITIFSNHAPFSIGEHQYWLLDTPGHADFGAEMERAIQAMDYAIVLVSCVEGIQAHTEQVWKLLKRYGVPVFFFLNKTDRTGARPDEVLHQLQKRMSSAVCDCSGCFGEGAQLSEELIEQIAAEDEELMEMYLDGGYEEERWLNKMAQLVAKRELFPCFRGSALQDEGIEQLLCGLDRLTLALPAVEEFSGIAWQVRHDPRGERVVLIKVQSGKLSARDQVHFLTADGQEASEKINELRVYSSGKFTTVQQAQAGQLCAATGLEQVRAGDGLGKRRFHRDSQLTPTLGAKVILPPQLPVRTALEKLRILEDEDPTLGISFEEELQEIHIRIMGQIQLEVLRQLCSRRFGIELDFGDCRILYRETISQPVVGYGHYEPLRHYAEVHLRLEPGQRGSGITFSSDCPTDLLGKNWQNLIRTHVFEKKHKGILTGSELCDVHITLLNGRAHIKHTEGGDFREATYRAIRQGLEQLAAAGGCVLLEPYYSFEAAVQPEQLGRLMADLQRMECSFEPPVTEEDGVLLCGRGPAQALSGYGLEFISYTRGKGILNLSFDGYEPCAHPQQVIEEIGYDAKHDLQNPSFSVFCSHGAGFPVPWQEVPAYIHCK